MAEPKNSGLKQFFASMQNGFNEWFRARACRRYFLLCLLFSFGMLAIAAVLKSALDSGAAAFFLWATVLSFAAAMGASISDTYQSRNEFNAQIRKLELEFRANEAREHGQVVKTSRFSPDEIRMIRRKKASFVFSIIIKVFFVIILIGLLVQSSL
jgi:hypothetical protein